MGILKAAIGAKNWELAAHALVLATVIVINGGKKTDQEKDSSKS